MGKTQVCLLRLCFCAGRVWSVRGPVDDGATGQEELGSRSHLHARESMSKEKSSIVLIYWDLGVLSVPAANVTLMDTLIHNSTCFLSWRLCNGNNFWRQGTHPLLGGPVPAFSINSTPVLSVKKPLEGHDFRAGAYCVDYSTNNFFYRLVNQS